MEGNTCADIVTSIIQVSDPVVLHRGSFIGIIIFYREGVLP